jgi:PEP-CTERM motif
MQRKITSLLSVAAFGALGSSLAHSAMTLYDSGGFEPTRFSTSFVNPLDPTVTGNLRGQDAVNDVWRESTTDPAASNPGGDGAATGTAVVETPTAPTGGSGLQDVKVTRTSFDDRWAPILTYTQNATNPVVNIDWSENVSETATLSSPNFGPYFGIEAYDTSAMRIGGLGVDATTGELLYEANGQFNTTPLDNKVTFGQYNNFEMSLDFTSHTYSISLNGTPLVTGINFLTAGVTGLTDADISALQADQVAFNPSGTAFFDNYVVTAVPEPTTAALLGIAIAALAGRRRRQSIPIA